MKKFEELAESVLDGESVAENTDLLSENKKENKKVYELNKGRVGKVYMKQDGSELKTSIVLSPHKYAMKSGGSWQVIEIDPYSFDKKTMLITAKDMKNLHKI